MTRSTAIRILSLAAAIGLLSQSLLIGNVFGLNLPLLAIALLAAAVALRPADRMIDPLDLWLPVAAIAVTAGIAIRSDPFLVFLDICAGCLLLGAAIAAIGGSRVTRRSAVGVVELALIVLGWTAAGILRVTIATRRGTGADEQPQRPPARVAPIVRGLLIAAPILLVFAGLFSSADAVFARLTEGLFSWSFDLGELPVRLAVAFVIGWVVAGLLAVAAGSLASPVSSEPVPQSLGAAAAAEAQVAWGEAGPRPLRLGTIEAATILIAVDLLFALFVILQLAYLFGGLDTLAATGLPYAQYARSGFFELVQVAVLAGALLVTIHGLAASRTAAIVGSGLALASLTAVILASAFLRLRIYQDAYGWTELRFYVLATIVWLAIGIGLTIVLLARDQMRWLLHGLAISAVAVLVAINLVGPARLIAEQNVARLLDPSLVPADGRTGLDLHYARLLHGDDAVPAFVAALPALQGDPRMELLALLEDRKQSLDDASTVGWPSWNLGRELARQALAGLPDH
jgi:hypothetical protein